jgi:hypothetical protein
MLNTVPTFRTCISFKRVFIEVLRIQRPINCLNFETSVSVSTDKAENNTSLSCSRVEVKI